MANTHIWKITQLECHPAKNGENNVVFNIHWERQASDNFGHTVDCYGSQTIELNTDSIFVAYEDLTFTQVCAWLENALGTVSIADMDTALDAQIAKQISPPIVSLPLPWEQ